ncbi:PH domain-containing protein [Tumebacillus lipolyticus]|uniref:PH domain-containing protein n=1 Tax=Tumebacillus lipolyticus TaxID=1280370 RepID=A0ABW5A1N4_9BACL
MRNPPIHEVDHRAVKVWRITALFTSLFYWLFPVGYYFLSKRVDVLPDWGLLLLLTLALIITLFEVIFVPIIRYRTWRYEITAEEIYLQHGVFVVRRSSIPMTRVQHVETAQGVLLRPYDLAVVSIFTAGGKHKIPALQVDVADNLRNKIAEFAKVVDDHDV